MEFVLRVNEEKKSIIQYITNKYHLIITKSSRFHNKSTIWTFHSEFAYWFTPIKWYECGSWWAFWPIFRIIAYEFWYPSKNVSVCFSSKYWSVAEMSNYKNWLTWKCWIQCWAWKKIRFSTFKFDAISKYCFCSIPRRSNHFD